MSSEDKVPLFPGHPLAKIAEALNLRDWFEEFAANVHDVAGGAAEPLPNFQTESDIRLRCAWEFVHRGNAAKSRRDISEEDLRYLLRVMAKG